MTLIQTIELISVVIGFLSLLLALIKIYIDLRKLLNGFIRGIVKDELKSVKLQIEEVKLKQNELEEKIEEIKKKLN